MIKTLKEKNAIIAICAIYLFVSNLIKLATIGSPIIIFTTVITGDRSFSFSLLNEGFRLYVSELSKNMNVGKYEIILRTAIVCTVSFSFIFGSVLIFLKKNLGKTIVLLVMFFQLFNYLYDYIVKQEIFDGYIFLFYILFSTLILSYINQKKQNIA